MKDRSPSPLRYPGGKTSLAGVLATIIYANRLQGCTYVEPFAGGAGAGIKLLQEGHVDRIVINDVDRAVYSFWRSVMRQTEEFVELIRATPLTIAEWHRQKAIYTTARRGHYLQLGFAAFFLNRCNRSGIIKNAGPIGGYEQNGTWRIDARFSREALAARIENIAAFGERIQVLRQDARKLLRDLPEYVGADPCFVYADPPYYCKGGELYLSHYSDADHVAFSRTMRETTASWVMTYDNVPRINEIYAGLNIRPFALRYSAHHASSQGGEVLISPHNIVVPQTAVDLLGGTSGYFRELPESEEDEMNRPPP